MITFTEFETTPATLIADLRTAILTNTHWSDLGITEVSTTSTGATTSAGFTVALTSVAGLVVGQGITITNAGGTLTADRVISGISGTTVTVSVAWGSIFPTGSTFKTRAKVLQCTTTDGAKMIVNLEGEQSTFNNLGVSMHTNWVGTAPDGFVDRETAFVYFKGTGGITNMPVHVTLSVSKDHLFVALEGPRAHELSPTSTTYGSIKNYFAMSSLVRYHAADTVPTVVGIGQNRNAAAPSVTQNSHQVGISRNSTDTSSWGAGRLASLDFPTVYSTDVITMNRACTIDGRNYLLPYVLFSEAEGIRGRLQHFFYCNTNTPSPATDYPDPVGIRVEYEGVIYRIIAANKGDANQVAWGPFGSASNGAAGTQLRTVLVAVPYAVAV